MIDIRKEHNLRYLNTFRLDSVATDFVELSNLSSLKLISDYIAAKNCHYLVLGGGSNLILPEFYNGLVIHNKLLGICIIAQDNQTILVKSMAGELWDDFVLYTISNGWFGLENLSLIPGTVGASLIQNIGAYGAEVADFIEYVEVFDIIDNCFRLVSNKECNFSYRNSIFKKCHNYIVISVVFRLHKKAQLNVQYADIDKFIQKHPSPTPLDLRNCVISIRQAKLPDPKVIPNVGSFFHNFVLSKVDAEILKSKYSDLPVYNIDDSQSKVSAGWLIDNLGLKGYRDKNMAVYEKQALVLVNYGEATQTEVLVFANYIQDRIKLAYNLDLNIEPIVVSGVLE